MKAYRASIIQRMRRAQIGEDKGTTAHMSNGIFIVSLDFELHWGGFEKWPIKNYEQYFLNTRNVIPELLKLFQKYEVHVTWATVGMLFHESKESMQKMAPDLKPAYNKAHCRLIITSIVMA